MTGNKRKLSACKHAEILYNTYQEWVVDMETTTDEQLKSLQVTYWKVIDSLREDGIGGVLINGTFRTTERN